MNHEESDLKDHQEDMNGYGCEMIYVQYQFLGVEVAKAQGTHPKLQSSMSYMLMFW